MQNSFDDDKQNQQEKQDNQGNVLRCTSNCSAYVTVISGPTRAFRFIERAIC